jgi:hypothetical protein
MLQCLFNVCDVLVKLNLSMAVVALSVTHVTPTYGSSSSQCHSCNPTYDSSSYQSHSCNHYLWQ